MSLFRIGGSKEEKPIQAGSETDRGRNTGLSALQFKLFRTVLGEIKNNQSIHFYSRGQWSNHQLLDYLLQLTGPADVFLSTWAIQETPVREILMLKDSGTIRSIECLFDYKICDRKSEAYFLAEKNFTRVKLTKCHAKVTVIRNDDFGITINGSANYTRNPRIESGVITVSKEIADFHIAWMNEELNKATDGVK